MNRLTNAELSLKARITSNAHGYDFLSIAESEYHSRAIAMNRTAFGGSHTSKEDIISELAKLPLLTVVTHHFCNNNNLKKSETQWKKVSPDAWVTV